VNPLTNLVEAALFSASTPLSLNELKKLDRESSKPEFAEALEELKQQYSQNGHGVELVEIADGFQIITRPEHAEAILRSHIVQKPRKLSPASMETLAIIAYRQPVGRAEIEEIRGVAADGVLRSLQDRGLIDAVERGEGLGRPMLYGTTDGFLELLGIKGVGELPQLDELSVELTPPAPPPPIEE
jgi:segregation and condensation protein B